MITVTTTKPDSEQLYIDYKDKVMAYFRSKINSKEDAEDLCQDVFMKIHSKYDSFDSSKSSVSTWIFTIARNTLTDYFRTNKQTEELTDDAAVSDFECENMLGDLADALSDLPQEQRDIIVLRYYNGLSLTEISKLMGISYGMTKVKHNKALAALKGLLGE